MPDPNQHHTAHDMDPGQILQQRLKQALDGIELAVGQYGLNLTVLSQLMEHFVDCAKKLPVPDDVACLAGCAYCCHTRVSTSIPEVLIIAACLRQSLPEGQLGELQHHLQQLCENGAPQSQQWWHDSQTPCPFLTPDTKLCMIYAIRPFTCRSHHSLSIDSCRDGFEQRITSQIPCYPLLRRGIDLYSTAFVQAMDTQKLPSYQVSFIVALTIALGDDQCHMRWFNGEDLFTAAAILKK